MSPIFAQPEPFSCKHRQWPDRQLTASPAWCSVDLRDGNQALPVPLSPERKLRFFRLLLDIGFKEIEVGFPSASRLDWDFCRQLIDDNLIPDDTRVSVLMPARRTLIAQTMKCLRGIPRAICHLYLPTSDLHTKFVLGKSRPEVQDMVLAATAQLRKLAAENGDSQFQLEFSTEEFTDSDLDFVSDLCRRVVEEWQPAPGEKVILNLPCTVERALPIRYADMIEEFLRRRIYPDNTIVSIHTHNDMGTATAQAELAMLAGARRVEGTLFGNGERAGNLDLVTLAANCLYLGLDTGLDLSRLEDIRDQVCDICGFTISPRHPYAGELTFTAFSGAHQDAIHKGLDKLPKIKKTFGAWKLPYLHLDPACLGRSHQDFIRINSQSGKGGIDYVLRDTKGVSLPDGLLSELRQLVKLQNREMTPDELWQLLLDEYLRPVGALQILKFWPRPDPGDPDLVHAEVHLRWQGQEHQLYATGQGPVAAFATALRQLPLPTFRLESYQEQAVGTTVNADALTIVSLSSEDNGIFYGLGFGPNIVQGAVQAIAAALNRLAARQGEP